MPRIPGADIEHLKQTILVARLAEARGVELIYPVLTAASGTELRSAHRKKSSCAKALIDALTFWCAGYRNVTAPCTNFGHD